MTGHHMNAISQSQGFQGIMSHQQHGGPRHQVSRQILQLEPGQGIQGRKGFIH